MQNPYTYLPLPTSSSLRLVTLTRSSSLSSPLISTISFAEIGDGTPYSVLSYTWALSSSPSFSSIPSSGEANASSSSACTISISGHSLPITRNLSDGLRRIRRRSEDVCMWVDAICIDQSNLHERSAQVAKMAEIFANASQLLVWLGEGECGGAAGQNERLAGIFECLSRPKHRHLNEHMFRTEEGAIVRICPIFAKIVQAVEGNREKYLSQDFVPDDDPWQSLREGSSGEEQLFDPCADVWLNCPDSELAYAAYHINRTIVLFSRIRYFSRRWIIQELFHAGRHDAHILWGQHAMLLRDFALALARFHPSLTWRETLHLDDDRLDHGKYGLALRGGQEINQVLSLRDHAKSKKEDFLIWIMASSNGFYCSEPIDYLYSILTIDPSASASIKLDYFRTPADVYISFAAYLIERGLYAEYILYAADRATHRKCEDSLRDDIPTWCIDLRLHFNFPKNTPTVGPCSLEDFRTLKATARILGSIESESKVESPHPPSRSYIYSDKARPGDTLCMFADYEPRQPDRLVPAIVLNAGEDKHRIIGWSYLCYKTWKPELYEVREIRLC